MIHRTLLAIIISLSLALTPAAVHADSGGGGDAGGLGDDPFAVQQRAAVVLTVILVATVFDQTARSMTLLNLGGLLQNQQNLLIQGGPDALSSMNQLLALSLLAFTATAVLLLAMARGARWQKRHFVPPREARTFPIGMAMMAFVLVGLLQLPWAMAKTYSRHGLMSTQ